MKSSFDKAFFDGGRRRRRRERRRSEVGKWKRAS